MNKKIIIFGIVVVALGVGGYFIYRNSRRPTREMFDEMVANCTPPCDVFSGLTKSQLDRLYDEYKKFTKEDAQFMIDFLGKDVELKTNKSEQSKFSTLFGQMAKQLKTK